MTLDEVNEYFTGEQRKLETKRQGEIQALKD